MSAVFHQRSIHFPYGDERKKAIREANQIVINLLVLLVIAHVRKIFFVLLS